MSGVCNSTPALTADCPRTPPPSASKLGEAITALERLGAGGGAVKRGGRPPQWPRAAQSQTTGDTDSAEYSGEITAINPPPTRGSGGGYCNCLVGYGISNSCAYTGSSHSFNKSSNAPTWSK